MALSHEDKQDVSKAYGKALAKKISKATQDYKHHNYVARNEEANRGQGHRGTSLAWTMSESKRIDAEKLKSEAKQGPKKMSKKAMRELRASMAPDRGGMRGYFRKGLSE